MRLLDINVKIITVILLYVTKDKVERGDFRFLVKWSKYRPLYLPLNSQKKPGQMHSSYLRTLKIQPVNVD